MAGPSVTVEMSADDLKLLKSLQKVIDKNREVEKSLDDTGKKGKDALKKIDDGLLSNRTVLNDAKSTVLGFASSFASVGSAVTLVTATIGKMNEAIEKSKQLTESLKTERANLASVAESAADYASLEQRSNDVAMRYGIAPDLARRMMFAARSSGFEANFEDAARFGAFFDPNAVSTAADKLPQIFRGQVNASQALNATYAAAKYSNLDFAQIASSAPSAAEGGAMIGATPQETLGVLSVLASQFGSGSTAADRMKAFGVQMSLQEGFGGLGYVESVRKLQEMSPEERSAILGTGQELNVAYQKLSENLGTIVERVQGVGDAIQTTGTDQDMISQMERIYFSTEQNQALLSRNRMRVAEELAAERQFSTGALNAESQMLGLRAQDWQRGRVNGAVGTVFAEGAGFLSPDFMPFGQALGAEVPGMVRNPSMSRVGPAAFRAGLRTAASRFQEGDARRETLEQFQGFVPESTSPTDIAGDIAGRVVSDLLGRLSRSANQPTTLSQPDVDK